MENKAEIAKKFCDTLRMTREFEELQSLEYAHDDYR